jgi:hypothetical protein
LDKVCARRSEGAGELNVPRAAALREKMQRYADAMGSAGQLVVNVERDGRDASVELAGHPPMTTPPDVIPACPTSSIKSTNNTFYTPTT